MAATPKPPNIDPPAEINPPNYLGNPDYRQVGVTSTGAPVFAKVRAAIDGPLAGKSNRNRYSQSWRDGDKDPWQR
ncbi:hypothetical protein EI983_18730 [Roseovarius faecimaris]|uniref:Uncharacterized protein n=1 Tax=Roseovarius faecimaris TaxID=2494550 RepID=A0A6I6IXL1_9RHOB|nr:hypothetical protein [Roseovarius faecimaris]QGY00188.1 hypothetical protein EI983_18730 [Roseovarius faecimaris]